MKIPATFRIDISRDKSCTVGGVRHAETKLYDNFGRHTGWICRDCGHKTYIKRRVKAVKAKVIL